MFLIVFILNFKIILKRINLQDNPELFVYGCMRFENQGGSLALD